MSTSDAYLRCEELGIPTDAPDALDKLWAALSVDERHEVFPFANDDGTPRKEPWPRSAPLPVGVGPDGYVLSEPESGEIRMWNGTSDLVFRVGARRARGEYRITYTSGGVAYSSWRELYESSHVIATAAEVAARAPHQHEAWQIERAADGGSYCTACGAVTTPAPTAPPVRGRLTFPPAENAARARELAAEHIRRARLRVDQDVPKGGRPWRPGDAPRAAVLREAADVLARLCAVYLGATPTESPRNRDEAHAYALAFRLVETSARRLSYRRIR